jgi:NOL1/NOP2/sun family putative RNA methylase
MRNKQDVLPREFIYRLKKIIPPTQVNSVLHSFTVKRNTTFRINTLKAQTRIIRDAFFHNGVKLENVLWYKDCFILQNRTLRELTEFEEYKNGLVYVQSFSSMIPPLVLDPKPNDKVLDIAAAPGSKTTQMAAMMENKGEMLANDSSPIRRYKLEANLKIQGVKNTYISGFPAQGLWQKFPEFFDKTLCDVPCSMEGRFHTFEPESYKGWSEKKVKNLSKLQKWMLRSAISATKVGGRIVYSTCTMSPEENEEVIDWILEKENGNITIENFPIKNLQFTNGLKEWERKEYNPQVVKTARILPSKTMEGFFVASIKKIKSNIPQISR